MAYSVTIFKHVHEGTDAFEEMEKFVKKADLVMFESAAITLAKEKKCIKKYNKHIKEIKNHKKSKNEFSFVNQLYEYGFWDLLIKYKKPVMALESYSKKESECLINKWDFNKLIYNHIFEYLHSGNYQEVMRYSYTFVNVLNQLRKIRDKNMANRISDLDGLIQNMYPEHNGSIKNVVATVGLSHNPEKYVSNLCNIKCKVYSTGSNSKSIKADAMPIELEDDKLAKMVLTHAFFDAFISRQGIFYTSIMLDKVKGDFSENLLKNLCNYFNKKSFKDYQNGTFEFFNGNYRWGLI